MLTVLLTCCLLSTVFGGNAPLLQNPGYKYFYGVGDPNTGDFKTQEETRDGDVVRGSYSLIDPDGTKRTVQYTADPHNGFNAVVTREPLTKIPVAKAPAPVVYAAPKAVPVYAAPSAPVYAPAAPVYAPAAPVYAPAPPVYSSAAPVYAPAAPAYAPAAPAYAPAPHTYAPAAPDYAPATPAYAPAPIGYASAQVAKIPVPVSYSVPAVQAAPVYPQPVGKIPVPVVYPSPVAKAVPVYAVRKVQEVPVEYATPVAYSQVPVGPAIAQEYYEKRVNYAPNTLFVPAPPRGAYAVVPQAVTKGSVLFQPSAAYQSAY